jgi:hypothetical protein
LSRVIPYRAQMGQHEITQKHTYLMGYCTYQKGTGLFWQVLSGQTSIIAAETALCGRRCARGGRYNGGNATHI